MAKRLTPRTGECWGFERRRLTAIGLEKIFRRGDLSSGGLSLKGLGGLRLARGRGEGKREPADSRPGGEWYGRKVEEASVEGRGLRRGRARARARGRDNRDGRVASVRRAEVARAHRAPLRGDAR